MKILYIGCFCEPSQEEFIKKRAKAKITVSATTFQKAFLSGLYHNSFALDYIVNVPDIGSYPLRCQIPWFSSSFFDYYGTRGVNASFLNVTVIKRFSIYRSIKCKLKKWAERHKSEQKIIIVYSLIYPYLKAAIDIKNKYPNTQICCIVLDLPQFFCDNSSWLYSILSKRTTKNTYCLIPQIDSFVLLTEAMATTLNIGNKPWMLMEGIYEPTKIIPMKKLKKTVLYTGNLDTRFGIRELLNAFGKIEDDNFYLWICGDGIDKHYVELAASKDSRIKYWGLIEQEKVFAMQREATLLINPRKGDAEFTKYSFPSKTMEYMASGTPTLMYKLPSLPQEYENFLVLIPDNSENSLVEALVEWGNKEQAELDSFGSSARDFIIDKKNSKSQLEKFIHFITNHKNK